MSRYSPQSPPHVSGEDALAITEWLFREHEAIAAAVNGMMNLDQSTSPEGFQRDGQLRYFTGADPTYAEGLWVTKAGVWTQII